MDSDKKIAQFFSALADETRLRILASIANNPQTVNEIHKKVGKNITLSAVSHQLKHLNSLDLIDYEKNGRKKRFKLSNKFCWCVLRDAVKHFKNENYKEVKK